MLLPGFSIARVPLLVRLFMGIALSLATYSFLRIGSLQNLPRGELSGLVLNELLVGVFFGFLAATFVHAVRFAANLIMALIGLAGIPGQPIDDLEPNPPFTMFISMVFTALVFATDTHLVGFGALIETYSVYPLGEGPKFDLVLRSLGSVLHDTSLMAVQASSPFILYGVGINFALGLVGKLTPQLQAYFALMGLSTLIALLGLYAIGSPLLSFMISSYADWLEYGL